MSMHSIVMVATLVVTLLCSGMVQRVHAQPMYSLGVSGMGMGVHWLGLTAEMYIYRPDTVTRLRSLNLAVSYGAPQLHVSYVPVELRAVLFSGSSHLEVAVGANIQVEYNEWVPASTFKEVPSYVLVPGASLAYRYEPDDGGFFFRYGFGVLFYYNDNLGQAFGTATAGFSF